ncbi:MAG: hypothetical protein H6812_03070 [Phycisphaeraceae bacterium]|nr:hypothetical protein [Phycisphaerales bacterium]MCB9842222.1 hypothetical protein [Phycisphaeraceae bacterium]
MRIRSFLLGLIAALAACMQAYAQDMTVVVDLSEAPRKLIYAQQTINNVPAGDLVLWYPKYVPGNHAASGPIRNVAGLEVRDADGRTLEWNRDVLDPYRIVVHVPDAGAVTIRTTYIASQPWHMSRSSDSYGFANFGAINWNTLVWYPEGEDCTRITVEAHVESPKFSEFGCSLAGHTARSWDVPGLTWTGPLTELIDSPVIWGEHLKRYNIPLPDRWPQHVLWINAARAQDTQLPEWMMERLRLMAHEAALIFGKFPRSEYHILCMADDSFNFGLEHATCTFLSAETDAFSGATEPKEGSLEGGMRHLTVIPHEYIHAWCGKLRAPHGLIHTDYHTPVDGSLLWVYEGLTTYYTQVLAARSGMTSEAEFKQWVLDKVVQYERQAGRAWRSIEDTARDVEHVRDRSDHWGDLRRGADYYSNAALFWLEADAMIRADSDGTQSLDDFCKTFFDVGGGGALPIGKQATYTRDDIVRTLASVDADRYWDALIRQRIEEPATDLKFTPMLDLLGLKVLKADEPSAISKKIHPEKGASANRLHSIGMSINESGEITVIVPGSSADKAQLAEGMRIIAVDEWVYSKDRLDEAISAARLSGDIVLTVAWGEQVTRRPVHYTAGPAWPVWGEIAGREDVLGAIAKARVGE